MLETGIWPLSTRIMPSGDLQISGVGLTDVANRYGTPTNVLDLAEFRNRCDDYSRAFTDAEVAYAGKALLTKAVARMVDAAGLSLDVCSEGELALALAASFPAERIIVHGNAKSDGFLRGAVAVAAGRIVVDNVAEIAKIARLASSDSCASRLTSTLGRMPPSRPEPKIRSSVCLSPQAPRPPRLH